MSDARRVYFPLASNGHSLLAGRPLDSVRRRLKIASLLHDEVFIESGTMQIQAGATGAVSWVNPNSTEDARWQTPAERGALQGGEFSLSILPTNSLTSADEPPTLRSVSAIAWSPTFEPFRQEIGPGTSWIQIGRFAQLSANEKAAGRAWRRRDDSNPVIAAKLPDSLVRNQVLSHVEGDLLLAATRGVSVSIDQLHASVLNSRLVDPRVETRGFALPFLAPRITEMSWKHVAEARSHKSIATLRKVLLEIEQDSLERVNVLGEIPDAVANSYHALIERYALDTPSVAGSVGYGVAEMAVGGAIGFATAGFGWPGIVIGAVPGAAVTALEVSKRRRLRRERAWISALQLIRNKAAPDGT